MTRENETFACSKTSWVMRGVRRAAGPNRLMPGVQAANPTRARVTVLETIQVSGSNTWRPARMKPAFYFPINLRPSAASATLISGDSAAPVR